MENKRRGRYKKLTGIKTDFVYRYEESCKCLATNELSTLNSKVNLVAGFSSSLRTFPAAFSSSRRWLRSWVLILSTTPCFRKFSNSFNFSSPLDKLAILGGWEGWWVEEWQRESCFKKYTRIFKSVTVASWWSGRSISYLPSFSIPPYVDWGNLNEGIGKKLKEW